MSEVPDNLYYTADHEWLLIADGVAVIGITDYAQDSLTDIVYVELPDGGSSFWGWRRKRWMSMWDDMPSFGGGGGS